MLVTTLMFLHHATTLLFGIYISAAFLGICLNRRNILILMGFYWTVGIFYISSFLLLGATMTEQIYPLLIHLPLILFLTLFYKKRALTSILAVFTAYLCCQISNWIGIAAVRIFASDSIYYGVRIAATVAVFILLMRYVADAAAQLSQKPVESVLIFSIIPFVYYIFDYATRVYTSLLYSGTKIVSEFLGFVLCFSYILFIFLYFRQYEIAQETESRNRLMKLKQEQSAREIESMRRNEKTISLLRHDMRHFLSNISTYIENGENEKAQAYIHNIIESVDKTVSRKYCSNDTINMILSSYEEAVRENGIDFRYTISAPARLPFSDVDMTSILSNALENAISAVLALPRDRRVIELHISEKNGKMLISISNTYGAKPVIVDGLPVSQRKNHGFGTQSICCTAEKLHGHCQFTVTDERFILRIVT